MTNEEILRTDKRLIGRGGKYPTEEQYQEALKYLPDSKNKAIIPKREIKDEEA